MPEIDCISGPFDRANDRIGRIYGKLAVASPCGCMLFGSILLFLTAIPFFNELAYKDYLGKPIRGPTNVGHGMSYRTDYEMWSPTETAVANRYKRVTDELPSMRRGHVDSLAYRNVAKGKAADEDILSLGTGRCGGDNIEDGREDIFYFSIYAKDENTDLCKDDRLGKVWEFEQYIKAVDRDGYAYNPDFCPLNPQLDVGSAVNTEGKSFDAKVLHKKPCGAYKEGGHPAYHEHPECILRKTSNDQCVCKNGPNTCAEDAFFYGSTRPKVQTCEVDVATTTCRDTRAFDASNILLADNQELAKTSTPLPAGAHSYKSAEACALQQPFVPGEVGADGKQLNHTGGDGQGTQLTRSMWCDKFSVVGPLGLLNAIAYAADVSADERIYFERMLYPTNYTSPTNDDGSPRANDTTNLPGMYGSGKSTILSGFPPRSAFATYLTNAFIYSEEIRDRRASYLQDGSCTSQTCQDTIDNFPFQLTTNFTSSNPFVQRAALEQFWTAECHDDVCKDDSRTFFPTTTTTAPPTTAAPGGGGSAAWMDYTGMNLDPSQPGEQDAALCATKTTQDDCFAIACQWFPLSEVPDQGGGVLAGLSHGVCRPCADDHENAKYNRITIGAGCASEPDACACAVRVGACFLPYAIAHVTCPQTCAALGTVGSTYATVWKLCVGSPAASSGGAGAMNPTCTHCNNFLQGSLAIRSSLEQDTEAKKAQCLLSGIEHNETMANQAGCKKELHRIGNPYQLNNCRSMLVAFRLRPVCELDHPSWRRISNNFEAPETLAREKWVRRTMEEYIENWKSDNPTESIVPTDPDSIYTKLWNAGVGVTIYHPNFLSIEITELLSQEIGSLGGTFFLMYFFLATAIGPTQWHRWVLSAIVLIQPFLALLFALGIGHLPLWVMVPGDMDKDGEDDKVLSVTILTAFMIHLLLAVVVDYNIILVRAFDRITTELCFADRIAVAVGYAHRTISVSMLVGIMAFAFGSAVDLPVVQYFCWHSALGMIGLYIGIFSVFLGGMVIMEGLADKQTSGQGTDSGNSTDVIEDTAKPKKDMNSAFKDLVVTDPRDLHFASLLSTPKIAGGILGFEFFLFFLFFIGQAAFPLTASFEGADYLMENSKVRLFTEKVNEMGGFPDSVVVWMPGTDIANYHIASEREYYKSVIDKFRDNVPGATKTGLPALFSWMHEFDMHTKGRKGDQRTAIPAASLNAVHEGCIPCPRVFSPSYYDTNVEIPGTVTNVTQLFSASGTLGVTRSGGSGVFTEFKIHEINDATAGLNSYTSRSDFLIDGSSTYLTKGFTIAAIYRRRALGSSSQGCQDLMYSADPTEASQRFSTIASVQDLITLLEDRTLAPEGFTLKLRKDGDARYTYQIGNLGDFAQCRPNDTSITPAFTNPKHKKSEAEFTVQRDAFWSTPEGKPFFYNMLHSWYEDWNDGTCCDAQFEDGTILGKSAEFQGKPNVNVYPKVESLRGRLGWSQTNGQVDGLKSTAAIFYMKYDLKDSKTRINAMNKIEEMLEEEREKYPHRWGKLDETGKADDSFVVARYFLNSDRDDNMLKYLWHHLIWVCGATIASCMIFMHPFYGFATGIFLGMVMFQIQGLMGLFGINLDIVSFAVLVMAMGFAIEYVVHIAHAFLHCSGKGLERTKNALEEMGLTVFSAFLSTAVQQLVLLFAAQSLAFELYPVVMLLVIIKSGISGFLMVPNFLGICDEYPQFAWSLAIPLLSMVIFVSVDH